MDIAKRNSVIKELKRYFNIKELVCPHIYYKWGEDSWQFLDSDYLEALLFIRRDILKVPMTCNFSTSHQRGMRCNRCDLVKNKLVPYLSSHILGKAGDFSVSGMTALQARQLIKDNAKLLPCNIRVEGGVSWLHIDTLPQSGITQKVYEFKA